MDAAWQVRRREVCAASTMLDVMFATNAWKYALGSAVWAIAGVTQAVAGNVLSVVIFGTSAATFALAAILAHRGRI